MHKGAMYVCQIITHACARALRAPSYMDTISLSDFLTVYLEIPFIRKNIHVIAYMYLVCGMYMYVHVCDGTALFVWISCYSSENSRPAVNICSSAGKVLGALNASCLLQIWDRRHGDHPVKQVPIHSGPVYCCDWHLENDNWILSAGRDKMIKVCAFLINHPTTVACISHWSNCLLV